MWLRVRRELLMEYYWWKRHSGAKKGLDSPLGIMGILIITSAVIVLVIIGQAFAAVFRNMIPIVGGNQIAGIYWYSITFAFKVTLALLLLFVSVVVYLFLKFTRRI
jgi:hypothetical protein